ncbi:MAG: HAD family phosphatase [Candidatus Cloacimonetes bacterium]|nr:HAD family phosphatase [Candidatus Cloacimonadota bacterium]
MVEAVIFDMDGVMIDSEREHYQVEQKFFQELGIDTEALEYNKFVGLSSKLMWTELQETFALPFTVAELMAKAAAKLQAHFEQLELNPMPGLIELLDYINERSMLIAVASSSPMGLIGLVVDRLGIRNYFDVLVSGDEVAQGKPFPDVYLHTAALLGASPEHCVVIEDSANGSRAAKKANMTCIGFRNPSSGEQDLSGCDLVVESFTGKDLEIIEENLW